MECDRSDHCRTTVEEKRAGRRRRAGAEGSLGGRDADGIWTDQWENVHAA